MIKSSEDDGSDIRVVAEDLGNITAIDISPGNFSTVSSVKSFRSTKYNGNNRDSVFGRHYWPRT